MKYMLLIYGSEDALTEQEFQDCIGKSLDLCDELKWQGQMVAASPLRSTATATTVRIRDGRRQITDGPFAETAEQLGGYYLLEVQNLDEAIAIASQIPGVHRGSVEIRPLLPLPERPAADSEVFRRELHIAAPPAEVFRALTTQDGISGWWTTSCTVAEGDGGAVMVRFDRTFKVFSVDKQLPPTEVSWRCIDARLDVPGYTLRPDEWVGTTISFHLRAGEAGGTVLSVQHVGLGPHFDCYDLCCKGWDDFLGSLRSLCETGRGMPFGAPPIPVQTSGK